MPRRPVALNFAVAVCLAACNSATPSPVPTSASPTSAPGATATFNFAVPEQSADPAYTSLAAPLIQRAADPQAGLDGTRPTGFVLHTGDYRLELSPGTAGVRLTGPAAAALALQPFGPALDALAQVDHVAPAGGDDQPGVIVSGSSAWMSYVLWLWVYPHNPGLLRYHLELTRLGDVPAGGIDLEWAFVDPATGEETAANYTPYADRSSFAAPSFYGYSAALGATLLHWVDLTRLNPLLDATGFSPANTPVRHGRRFGHDLTAAALSALPEGRAFTVYDSYLYLAPGEPADEPAMSLRYLQETADIYDLIAHPITAQTLPDWQALAAHTLTDLQDPDTWLMLDGQRYWRAYVGDTRQSAEAITQFDLSLATARYVQRYQSDLSAAVLLNDMQVTLPHFYNPAFGLIQNSGPLSVTGDQGRGDTWYELEHALKAAELGLLGNDVGRQLALDSQAAWTNYAHTVSYKFPRFYSFKTWTGSEREPDAAGGYALYMLRLEALGCPPATCRAEAEAAVKALGGYGFGLAYETHMTAMSALAAAIVADETGDDAWLQSAYAPIANLMRLSWIYEIDYGPAAPVDTFFGLSPTQRSGVVSPKEQYEAWLYLGEFLRRAHGRIDPGVEKLVSEFWWHTLVTMAGSLPPRLPAGVATLHPAAYSTVSSNRLDLYLPLEDLRDGRSEWGAIGQQVYGAGLAPTLAALAYTDIGRGITVYGGYPAAASGDGRLTFAGVPGAFAPAQAAGAAAIQDAAGRPIPTAPCAPALCFQAEGGATYVFQP